MALPVVDVTRTVRLGMLGYLRWRLEAAVAEGELPVAPLERYFPIVWAGFWVSAISGAILFAADATSKIVSPLFGVKMLLIVLGVLTMVFIRRTVFRAPGGEKSGWGRDQWLVSASLVVWFGAIAAGRLMAYIAF